MCCGKKHRYASLVMGTTRRETRTRGRSNLRSAWGEAQANFLRSDSYVAWGERRKRVALPRQLTEVSRGGVLMFGA